MFRKQIVLITVFIAVIIGTVNLVGCFADEISSDIESSSSEFSESGEIIESAESERSETEESKEIICVVTFDSDGGTKVNCVRVKKDEKINEPDQPKKDIRDGEYTFLGWYYGDKKWDFGSDVVSSDMTLIAKWEKSGGYTKPF